MSGTSIAHLSIVKSIPAPIAYAKRKDANPIAYTVVKCPKCGCDAAASPLVIKLTSAVKAWLDGAGATKHPYPLAIITVREDGAFICAECVRSDRYAQQQEAARVKFIETATLGEAARMQLHAGRALLDLSYRMAEQACTMIGGAEYEQRRSEVGDIREDTTASMMISACEALARVVRDTAQRAEDQVLLSCDHLRKGQAKEDAENGLPVDHDSLLREGFVRQYGHTLAAMKFTGAARYAFDRYGEKWEPKEAMAAMMVAFEAVLKGSYETFAPVRESLDARRGTK